MNRIIKNVEYEIVYDRHYTYIIGWYDDNSNNNCCRVIGSCGLLDKIMPSVKYICIRVNDVR